MLRRAAGRAVRASRAAHDPWRAARPRPSGRHPRRRARRRRALVGDEIRPAPKSGATVDGRLVHERLPRAAARAALGDGGDDPRPGGLPDGLAALGRGATPSATPRSRPLAGGDEVVVVGCGTSEHGAMAVAALLRDGIATVAPGCPPDPAPAGPRRCARPSVGRPRDRRLATTAGRARRSLALERARAAGAVTAAITARPDSDFAEPADHVVTTPLADRSWCHTVAYTSAILAARRSPRPVGRVVARVGPDRARGCPRRRWSPPRRAAAAPGPAACCAPGRAPISSTPASSRSRSRRARGSRLPPTTSRPCSTATWPACEPATTPRRLPRHRPRSRRPYRARLLALAGPGHAPRSASVDGDRTPGTSPPAGERRRRRARRRRRHRPMLLTVSSRPPCRPVDDARTGRRGRHQPRPDPPRARAVAQAAAVADHGEAW